MVSKCDLREKSHETTIQNSQRLWRNLGKFRGGGGGLPGPTPPPPVQLVLWVPDGIKLFTHMGYIWVTGNQDGYQMGLSWAYPFGPSLVWVPFGSHLAYIGLPIWVPYASWVQMP